MSETPKWRLTWNPNFPSIQDNAPLDDGMEHMWGGKCPCCPKKVPIHHNMHVVAIQWTHVAQDGRVDA